MYMASMCNIHMCTEREVVANNMFTVQSKHWFCYTGQAHIVFVQICMFGEKDVRLAFSPK